MTKKRIVLLSELAAGATLKQAAVSSGYSDEPSAHRASRKPDSLEFFREVRRRVVEEVSEKILNTCGSSECESPQIERIQKYLSL